MKCLHRQDLKASWVALRHLSYLLDLVRVNGLVRPELHRLSLKLPPSCPGSRLLTIFESALSLGVVSGGVLYLISLGLRQSSGSEFVNVIMVELGLLVASFQRIVPQIRSKLLSKLVLL